jgi:hypothetical protein
VRSVFWYLRGSSSYGRLRVEFRRRQDKVRCSCSPPKERREIQNDYYYSGTAQVSGKDGQRLGIHDEFPDISIANSFICLWCAPKLQWLTKFLNWSAFNIRNSFIRQGVSAGRGLVRLGT